MSPIEAHTANLRGYLAGRNERPAAESSDEYLAGYVEGQVDLATTGISADGAEVLAQLKRAYRQVLIAPGVDVGHRMCLARQAAYKAMQVSDPLLFLATIQELIEGAWVDACNELRAETASGLSQRVL